MLSLAGNSGPISINLNTVTNCGDASIRSEISRIVDGDVAYNEQDERLLGLFQTHAGKLEGIQLRSDLDQLKDASTPDASRKTAGQRVLSFLYRVGAKVGDTLSDVGVKALAAYLISSAERWSVVRIGAPNGS